MSETTPKYAVEIPAGLLPHEQLIDLLTGTHLRLSQASWDARRACECITHSDKNPLEMIAEARLALDMAERYATAHAALEAQRTGTSYAR